MLGEGVVGGEWRKPLLLRLVYLGLMESFVVFRGGGLILVLGLLGFGKTIFGVSYIYYGAVDAQEPGLYISMFEGGERFLDFANGLGMDFQGSGRGEIPTTKHNLEGSRAA